MTTEVFAETQLAYLSHDPTRGDEGCQRLQRTEAVSRAKAELVTEPATPGMPRTGTNGAAVVAVESLEAFEMARYEKGMSTRYVCSHGQGIFEL